VIDLSYAAAYKVGIAGKGSGEVVVESIIPGDAPILAAAPPLPPVVATAPPVVVATAPSSAVPAPALVPPPPAPAAPAAISRDTGGGYSVQLGAFQNYANAQPFLSHVQGQLATAQVEPKVRDANGLYRVYVGPYPDRDEAKRVADRIGSAFGFATSVAPH
jgi:rare lipoprotein A